MKIALCFIINYDHVLHKETIWREWVAANKDIINIYIYYKDLKKIQSPWLQNYAIPEKYINETSYYHVVPAYISLIKYAIQHDKENQWFCFLTDSCCPIISPEFFRYLFFTNYNKTIMKWGPSWWNIFFHKRANLRLLPNSLHLANDPWFVLQKQDAEYIIQFTYVYSVVYKKICSGGLANESIFAIILKGKNNLEETISKSSHIINWRCMSSATSPYVFKNGDKTEQLFIDTELKNNKYAMFIRKISPTFPDSILKKYIYENKEKKINWREKIILFLLKYYCKYKYLFNFLFKIFI